MSSFNGKSVVLGSDTDGERVDLEDAGLKKVVPVKNMDDSGNVIGSTPAAIGSGSKDVTTPGTQVAVAASTACRRVIVQAKITNTGYIYVGASDVSSANGISISAGNSVTLNVSNLNLIFIDADTGSEGVTFLYEV